MPDIWCIPCILHTVPSSLGLISDSHPVVPTKPSDSAQREVFISLRQCSSYGTVRYVWVLLICWFGCYWLIIIIIASATVVSARTLCIIVFMYINNNNHACLNLIQCIFLVRVFLENCIHDNQPKQHRITIPAESRNWTHSNLYSINFVFWMMLP